jgi:hypothetical protein
LTPDRIPAALFAAATLSSHRELDSPTRLRIISRVPAFDIKSEDEARDALRKAFQSAGVPSPHSFPSGRVRSASVAAEEWLGKKIFVMSRRNLTAPGRYAQHIPEVVFAFGDPSIASSRAAAVLNSRKPRRACPDDSWIRTTGGLVRYAKQAKLTVISSYGTIAYCMVSRLAVGMPLIVVCDDVLPFMFSSRAEDFFSKYGDLFRCDSTLFISPFPPAANLQRGVRSGERDLLVAALASILLVAELKSGGNMEKIVESAGARNIEVIRHSDCDAPATVPAPPVIEVKSPTRPTVIPTFREISDNTRYLIHYTRSCPGPWPGQTVADYCLSLISGCERSRHTGFDTLLRILEENSIRGSSRLTRRGHCVVSLSECYPKEISTLTKWRRSLIRWSFEPYGVAFPKDDLFRLGALPVIYAVEEAFQDLAGELQHLFQLQGRNTTDWSAEKEWRLRGDLVLNEALREKMVVIVPTRKEATIIAREFGFMVALATSPSDSSSCEPS